MLSFVLSYGIHLFPLKKGYIKKLQDNGTDILKNNLYLSGPYHCPGEHGMKRNTIHASN